VPYLARVLEVKASDLYRWHRESQQSGERLFSELVRGKWIKTGRLCVWQVTLAPQRQVLAQPRKFTGPAWKRCDVSRAEA
jgi:hypothetical protein